MTAQFGTNFDLPQWARESIRGVESDDLIETVVQADMQAAFQHLRGNEEFLAQLTASVQQNLTALTDVAAGRVQLCDVQLPQPRLLAALQARLGVPQTLLQLSYRVGFLTIWREWTARLDAAPVSSHDRAAAGRIITELIFAYQNAALDQVAAEHVRTEAALLQSRDHVRRRLIRDILGGVERPVAADFVMLGYDLDVQHIAVSTDAVGLRPADWIARIRATCQVWDTLHFCSDDDCSVWWFGRHSWTERAQHLLLAQLRDAGVRAEVAEPRQGLSGFRDSYRQLIQTRAIRAAWARTDEMERTYGVTPIPVPPVLCYVDLRIEALLLEERDASAAFVAHELGPLAAATRSSALLRETLQHWLETRSHVLTAQQLGLHEHTVRNRLRRIEEVLGRPITVRPTELVLALRMRRVVGGEPASAQNLVETTAYAGRAERFAADRAVSGE